MDTSALFRQLKDAIKPFTPAIDTFQKVTSGSEHYRRRRFQEVSKETTDKLGSVSIRLLTIAFMVFCAYLSFSQNKSESMLTQILYATFAAFFGVIYVAYYVLRYGLNIGNL